MTEERFVAAAHRLFNVLEQRRALKADARSIGDCERMEPSEPDTGYIGRAPCNLTEEPESEWCEACKGREPFWAEHRALTNEYKVARQAFMRAGKSL